MGYMSYVSNIAIIFFRVGNGVKHFREKNFKDAWKCFDQAISFYPANVEGFVARGAL